MTARLFAAVRRWVHVALFGWADQCDAPECTATGEWVDLDGGAGRYCASHRGRWS